MGYVKTFNKSIEYNWLPHENLIKRPAVKYHWSNQIISIAGTYETCAWQERLVLIAVIGGR